MVVLFSLILALGMLVDNAVVIVENIYRHRQEGRDADGGARIGTDEVAAPVIASLPTDLDCQPDEPISILIMNGTEDPLVPWEGGQVHFLRKELGGAVSTPDMIAFWVEANGCDPTPTVERLPDLDPDDEILIQKDTYSDCLEDTQVVLYTVEGGGHTWPGGPQYAPKPFIGRVSRDLHAGEAIWTFFEDSARIPSELP